MQAETELWTTALFNRFLAGPLDSFLSAIGHPAADPAHPWENWITMEILVVAIILVLFARAAFQALGGKSRQAAVDVRSDVQVRRRARATTQWNTVKKYAPFFGTLFIFILFMNLIGVIPGFESPTMTLAVPLGLAVVVFLYYHWMGLREQGIGKYLAHFVGPMLALRQLMIPIEIISHLCAAAVAHDSSFRQHVRRREGNTDFPDPHYFGGCRRSSWGCTSSSHSCRLIYSCCSP